MLHAFVSILAAVEEEKSRTPFYVVGCVFGVWAIALFYIGRSAPTFPASKRTALGLMVTSVLLALVSSGLAVYVS